MHATARDTGAALKRHVLPLLRREGFDDGALRRLWRYRGGGIDHVEMASFSTYQASTLGCSTASFAVRLGRCLPGYGSREDPFQRDHLGQGPHGPRPRESQIPIRGVLCPSDAPPMTRGRWGWEFQWVWRVDAPGDADPVALDVVRQFQDHGMDWLSRAWDLHDVVALLKRPEPSPLLASAPNGGHLGLDAGLPGSPVRNAHLAMAKRALHGTRLPG